ncbi:MAG: translocation/assembly module TamB domain-containing protein, partial [Amphiplicatus sp.]
DLLLVLFHTPPGRAFLVSLIEKEAGKAIGGKAEIGALGGVLPNNVVLSDVVFTKDGRAWLRVDRLEMDWNALAVLRRVDIGRLSIRGAHLLAPPPEKRNESPPKKPVFLSLPRDLPALSIGYLTLDNLVVDEDVAGRALRLNAVGAVGMDGRSLDLRLKVTSSGDSDKIDATIALGPRRRGVVDLAIAAAADGFIAALLGLDAPLRLEAHGDAPPANFILAVKGDIGAFGSIDSRLAGDLYEADTLRVDAAVTFGEKLGDLSDIFGATASLAGTLGLDAAAGERAYALDATFAAPDITLALEGGKTDFKTRLSGLAALTLAPSERWPLPLDAGLAAQSVVSLGEEGLIRLDELALTTPDGSHFEGEARWDLTRDALALGGAALATPEMTRRLAGGLSPDADIAAQLSAAGPIDGLGGEIALDLPRVAIGDGALPPSVATIRFKRTDTDISATVAGRLKAGYAKKGKETLKANAVRSEDGTIALTGVEVKAKDFSLTGEAAYSPAREAVEMDLAYKGMKGAEPWPGVLLAGELSVKGALAREGGANDIALAASDLSSGDIAVGAVEARVQGPSTALAVNASLTNAALPSIGKIDKMRLIGRANLKEKPSLVLSTLEGALNGVPARLTSPTTLLFDGGVAVSGLKASLGEKGALALDGSFSSTRWRAKLTAKEAPLREQAAVFSLRLDLDTQRENVASGDFEARSRLADRADARFAGDFAWDGKSLRLSNSGPEDGVAFDLALPLLLNRTPNLGVRFEGALEGAFTYDGRIETVAAYMPPSLQALEGAIAARASLGGTVKSPEIAGRLAMNDGAYTELSSGLSITHINGEATARAGGGATAIDFDFKARGVNQERQTVSFAGKASLGEEASIDSALTLDGARFSAGPISAAVATGEVAIAGPLRSIEATGEITVRELDATLANGPPSALVDIDVVPIDGEEANGAETEFDAAPPVVLDLKLAGDDKLFVRGRGLESEWRAALTVKGDAENPLIEGSLALRRGYLDFAGRRFSLTRGAIQFDRYAPGNPMLDIRAENETGEGMTAVIEIKGRAESPSISLSSTPSRPADDVMALILFGKPATELTALETLQVAQALAQLTGVGPFGGVGVTGRARRMLGVDMLSLDIDPETGASELEVGKYVADGLFVSATQDARGESGSIRVEYDVTKSISVETKIQQDGDQTVSANWKKDF